MARSNEPIWWSLFSSGGVVAAFFLPVTLLITAIVVPAGWLKAKDLLDLVGAQHGDRLVGVADTPPRALAHHVGGTLPAAAAAVPVTAALVMAVAVAVRRLEEQPAQVEMAMQVRLETRRA